MDATFNGLTQQFCDQLIQNKSTVYECQYTDYDDCPCKIYSKPMIKNDPTKTDKENKSESKKYNMNSNYVAKLV